MLLKEIKLLEFGTDTPFSDIVDKVRGHLSKGTANKAKKVEPKVKPNGLDPALEQVVKLMVSDLNSVRGLSTQDLKKALNTPQLVATAIDGFNTMTTTINGVAADFIRDAGGNTKVVQHLDKVAQMAPINGCDKTFKTAHEWMTAVFADAQKDDVPKQFHDMINTTVSDNEDLVTKALMNPTEAENLAASVVHGLEVFVDRINAVPPVNGHPNKNIATKSYPVLAERVWGFLGFCGRVQAAHSLIIRLLEAMNAGKSVKPAEEPVPPAKEPVPAEKELELEPKT